jgi:hypothetical protein
MRFRAGKEVRLMGAFLCDLWKEEDAIGVVEIILILVVLIGLVIIFKNQLVSLVKNILSKITSQSNSI